MAGQQSALSLVGQKPVVFAYPLIKYLGTKANIELNGWLYQIKIHISRKLSMYPYFMALVLCCFQICAYKVLSCIKQSLHLHSKTKLCFVNCTVTTNTYHTVLSNSATKGSEHRLMGHQNIFCNKPCTCQVDTDLVNLCVFEKLMSESFSGLICILQPRISNIFWTLNIEMSK